MKTRIILLAAICVSIATACNQSKNETAMKNEVIENIMSRRSIRAYKDMPVGRDTLTKIMECAISLGKSASLTTRHC